MYLCEYSDTNIVEKTVQVRQARQCRYPRTDNGTQFS